MQFHFRFLLVLISLILSTNSSWAGNEVGNGGDVVICKGKEPVMLDYYHAKLKRFGDTNDSSFFEIGTMDENQVIEFFKKHLWPLNYSFSDALFGIGKISDWMETDLKDINDSAEPYLLPSGCKLRQVAIRQGSEMFIDPKVAKLLSPAQLGVLRVHEALYLLASERGYKNSQVVRSIVRMILRNNSSNNKFLWECRKISRPIELRLLLVETYLPSNSSAFSNIYEYLKFEPIDDEPEKINGIFKFKDGKEKTLKFQCFLEDWTCTSTLSNGDEVILQVLDDSAVRISTGTYGTTGYSGDWERHHRN